MSETWVEKEATISMARVLVLGTRNEKKRSELEKLLAPLGFELHQLADYAHAIDVAETGATFAENAALKAVEQATHLGRWVLGEDSGLCVEALDGAPGVYSARFSGPNASDAGNNAKLLKSLSETPPEARRAFYVCSMALADPSGEIHARAEGRCYGRIRTAAAGSGGFGYDPLFEVVEHHRTFGELGANVKAMISHRARAVRRFVPQLIRVAVGCATDW